MKLTTIKIKPQLLEMWKIVDEFPNYAISTLGRIKSLNYKKQGYVKILRQQKNHRGYPQVHLWNDQGRKSVRIHRLVAKAFIPNPENKATVNHINEIKEDNRVKNLEWMTDYENNRYGNHDIKARKKKVNGVRSKKIVGVNIYTGKVVFFPSGQEALRQLGINPSPSLRGKVNSCKGYVWYYLEDYEVNGDYKPHLTPQQICANTKKQKHLKV